MREILKRQINSIAAVLKMYLKIVGQFCLPNNQDQGVPIGGYQSRIP